MTTSFVHQEKLAFLSAYVSALEEGGRFASDQVVTREIAKLKRAGYTDNHPEATERMAQVQLFAIDAMETVRAQMVVLIWVFYERFLSDALESLRTNMSIATRFKQARGESFVVSARRYIENDLRVELSITEQEWVTLSDMQQIRNFLAHCGNRPGAPPKGAQRDAVLRQPGLQAAANGILVSRDFLIRQIDFAQTFVRKFDGDHWERSERFDLEST